MKDVHLFFDLDRTLWDFEKNSREALKLLFKKYKLDAHFSNFIEFHSEYKEINNELWLAYGKKEITKEELRITRFIRICSTSNLTENEIEEFAQDYIDVSPYQKNLLPFAIETLETLKSEGYPMHIITNGFEEVQHIKLRNSGLDSYFDVILCSEATGSTKPDPIVFETALKEAGASKSKSIMIGDDYQVDYLGALNCGMKSIWFNHRNEKKFREDDETIAHLNELPGRIPWLMRS